MADITTTVDSSEATVKAVRQEIPLGVGGEAIARVPYSPSLQRLIDTGGTTLVLKGTTRCIRIVEVAVQGGGSARFHCSRPCVGVGGQQLCPDHDREAFKPNQSQTGPRPAVTTSASIKLTKAEMDDMGVKESPATVGAPVVSKSPPAPNPKPKKPRSLNPKAGEKIRIELSVEELETNALPALLVARIALALDNLPATTVARMKKIVALQEKIVRWGQP